MPTNQTENYQLSQWEKPDKVQMEDFNADNAKIDAALAALATKVPASHLSAYSTSYSGNGATSRTHTLPGKPVMVMIQGSNRMYFGARGIGILFCPFLTDGYGSVSWGADSITISGANSDRGANQTGFNYSMFALLEN